MFRVFSPCRLPPNVERLPVELQRVRLLAVVPLTLIRSQLSAVNVSHHTALDQAPGLLPISISPLRNLENNLRTVRSLVPTPHALLTLATITAIECPNWKSC
ncbi:hypothetical protein TNIN_398081 [Trichonephila inaurata madagascariensis]|uniref:Uncharacterized protein n=1 Tax=Trichonephila inaurata madagascariensis TaxID=2747483 RepID=A0A8X7C363_9ARAC|nr:hypothetical protein TNIN_398081 [Trichonephila inaurata madagascariensis]